MSEFRSVDALTGKRAPSRFFQALSEADSICQDAAELEALRDENASLRCRLDELAAELEEVRPR